MAGNRSWTTYWDYTFDAGSNTILYSDSGKASDIANYMGRNPSYQIGLDGSDSRRVGVVRDALIDAGVSASRIQIGAFGDSQFRRDSRVAVLVSN